MTATLCYFFATFPRNHIFASVNDPVASGIVPRLDRPNGNITGLVSWALHALVAPYLMIYKFSASQKTGPSDATSGGNGVPGMIKNDETDLPQQ
jgi:hypothetical protein